METLAKRAIIYYTSINVDGYKFRLRRMPSGRLEKITWMVLSEDKKTSIGMLARYNSNWLLRKVGWQEHPIQYWLLHVFYHPRVISGKTMREVLSKYKKGE